MQTVELPSASNPLCADEQPVTASHRRPPKYRICKECREKLPIERFVRPNRTTTTVRCDICRAIPRIRPKEPAAGRREAVRRWDAKHASDRAAKKAAYRRDHPWETWGFKCLHSKRQAGETVVMTWADIAGILKKQKYRCALTGLPFWRGERTPGTPSWDSPSMDRIEPDGDYSAPNVRIVLHCVNSFRGRMNDSQMLEVAKALLKIGRRNVRKSLP